MDLNIDRSNWTKVRLGEVVQWYQKDIPNELQTEQKIEYYITASEIDGDEISITRYKELSDGQKGPTITKHFEKGDLLLSTRSVALRKAAIAPVSGVTGEKLLVLRCIEDGGLDPELMPFVFQSAHFWHYAQNSASGSVNKFTSWTKLAKYEFLLPPKEQQAELAELLWAMDEVIGREKEVLDQLKKGDLAHLKHHFFDDKTVNRIKLKNIVSIKKGRKPTALMDEGDGLPYCTAKYLRTDEIEFIVPKEYWSKSVKIDDSDILVLWDGSNAGEMLFGKEGILASTMCKLDIVNTKYLKKFVFQFLRFKTNDIKRATVGSAIPHVDPGMIDNIEIPELDINEQKEIIQLLNDINENVKIVESKIFNSQSLQKSIVNQIF